MKRLLMLSSLLIVAIGLNGCFFFLGADPEVEYVVYHSGATLGTGMTVTYVDENMELQEVFTSSDYFQTSFSVSATEKTLTFIQGEGQFDVGGPYTLTVQVYVDGYLRRQAIDTDDSPLASAAYLIEP